MVRAQQLGSWSVVPVLTPPGEDAVRRNCTEHPRQGVRMRTHFFGQLLSRSRRAPECVRYSQFGQNVETTRDIMSVRQVPDDVGRDRLLQFVCRTLKSEIGCWSDVRLMGELRLQENNIPLARARS